MKDERKRPINKLRMKKYKYWHKLFMEDGKSILEIASSTLNPMTGMPYTTVAIRDGIRVIEDEIAKNYETQTS